MVCGMMHIKEPLPMWWQRVSSLAVQVVLYHMSDANFLPSEKIHTWQTKVTFYNTYFSTSVYHTINITVSLHLYLIYIHIINLLYNTSYFVSINPDYMCSCKIFMHTQKQLLAFLDRSSNWQCFSYMVEEQPLFC